MLSAQASVLEDQVFNSSTLAKQTSMVLDQANKGFVTITRNNDAYALVKRDQASWLVKANRHLGEVCQVIAAASQRLIGQEIDGENPYQWVGRLGTQDLKSLVSEITALLGKATVDHSQWEELDAVVYEWHQSSIAANDADHKEAFRAPNEAIELPVDTEAARAASV